MCAKDVRVVARDVGGDLRRAEVAAAVEAFEIELRVRVAER